MNEPILSPALKKTDITISHMLATSSGFELKPSHMKICVTGAAGFIGSNLTDKLLADGHEVVGIDCFNTFYQPEIKRNNLLGALASEKFTLVEADITDPDKIKTALSAHPVEAIIHLAARAGVRPSIEEPALYNDVNIQGTLHLLEIARAQGIKKFVFGSSSSVYGTNAKIPFNETDPIFNAISPYAATKLAGEALCHVYHHLYGIDIPCLRFFTVYGPRQRPDLAIHKFTKAIHEGRSIQQYGNGTTKRDYTFVTDIVDGICAATFKPIGYEIINLGNSHPTPLIDLIGLIERNLGKVAKIEYLPDQPGDVPITFADVSKAHQLLSYQPQILIEEGIARFTEWFNEVNG